MECFSTDWRVVDMIPTTENNPLKVMVVDDHTLFRKGIISVLSSDEGLNIVGEASDGYEAIKMAKEKSPDIIIMDLNMPGCDGLKATQEIHINMPQVNILVLTVSESESDIFEAIKYGARGYILKNIDPSELVHTVRHIGRGGVIISPNMATKLITEFKLQPDNSPNKSINKAEGEESDNKLSIREIEVLELTAKGATNKQIADSLFISESTVKSHLRNIMEKLHLANRSQATAYAIRSGIAKDNYGEKT